MESFTVICSVMELMHINFEYIIKLTHCVEISFLRTQCIMTEFFRNFKCIFVQILSVWKKWLDYGCVWYKEKYFPEKYFLIFPCVVGLNILENILLMNSFSSNWMKKISPSKEVKTFYKIISQPSLPYSSFPPTPTNHNPPIPNLYSHLPQPCPPSTLDRTIIESAFFSCCR